MIGLLFLNPLLGFAVGASAGAASGALTDIGINDDFMKELAATLTPGSSALFVLVRKMTVDKVLEAIAGTGGKRAPDFAFARRRRPPAGRNQRRQVLNGQRDSGVRHPSIPASIV